MNFTTQYSLIISNISALVIVIGMIMLISQIRTSRIEQVGRNYQTIAENFARLAGSHLEQQMHTLKFLTQQVPIFQESLVTANTRYHGGEAEARLVLKREDLLWQKPIIDNAFVIDYLKSPVMKALSDFRGRNSFHGDILLVDRHGGLVGNLGVKPEHFYVYDAPWWEAVWNNGLGNSYIGDLTWAEDSRFPKLRMAVEIIEFTSNDVIGALSSMYLLRTLIEDMERFKPQTVGMITLLDADGNVIASSDRTIIPGTSWPRSPYSTRFGEQHDSTWSMGVDLHGNEALIGISSLSTEYSVISDPLQRLCWYVAVSGTRSEALADVTRSTKVALLYGLLAMALGVLIAIFTARVITRPIQDLTETAIVMGDGDLTKRAEPQGPMELVALAESFNRLTDRLHEVIHNLKSQTEQLARAKAEAETATRLKGEFLATMSHEIRTPLNAILGFADITESSATDEVSKRYARIIKTSGTDLLHLINDILDLSKIEAGKMELVPEPVRIAQIVDDLKRIFSVSADQKGILLEMEVAASVPEALILDAKRVKQVLFNLLGNGVKFTDHGKVSCLVRGEASTTPGRWDIWVLVRDTGSGIAPEEQERIFENFHQQRGQAAGATEGTGLGLAITRSLVEMMGGTIEVESELGIGSRFTVFLPQVEVGRTGGVTERGKTPETVERTLAPAAILVVDDLDINRHLVLETLKKFPLEIAEAGNGSEALALLATRPFDMVLLDIRMPGMDGFATLEALDELAPSRSFPVIAVTASGMTDEIARIIEAGFDDHLIRPFTQSQLIEMVANYLPAAKEEPDGPEDAGGSTVQSWQRSLSGEGLKRFTGEMKQRLDQVEQHQSMPEVLEFAGELIRFGEMYAIDPVARLGRLLQEDAHAFDIDQIEQKLAQVKEWIRFCTTRHQGDR